MFEKYASDSAQSPISELLEPPFMVRRMSAYTGVHSSPPYEEAYTQLCARGACAACGSMQGP